jgi:hypothetical protein
VRDGGGAWVPKKSQKFKPDENGQSKLFIKKAREIGADEENSRAPELLAKLSKMKLESRTKRSKK